MQQHPGKARHKQRREIAEDTAEPLAGACHRSPEMALVTVTVMGPGMFSSGLTQHFSKTQNLEMIRILQRDWHEISQCFLFDNTWKLRLEV